MTKPKPEPGKASCIAIGLMIFSMNGDDDVSSEHDKIWAGSQVSKEESILLERLGWLWDEGYDSWFIFS